MIGEGKPPKFPYVAAALCAACVGAAAWTWMRYSYAQLLSPRDLVREESGMSFGAVLLGIRLEGAYVLVRGESSGSWDLDGSPVVCLSDPSDRRRRVEVLLLGTRKRPVLQDKDEALAVHVVGTETTVTGRVVALDDGSSVALLALSITASRFTGASIAGLVVGAMGVFVFTVALRHWLGERRKFREAAEGA